MIDIVNDMYVAIKAGNSQKAKQDNDDDEKEEMLPPLPQKRRNLLAGIQSFDKKKLGKPKERAVKADNKKKDLSDHLGSAMEKRRAVLHLDSVASKAEFDDNKSD